MEKERKKAEKSKKFAEKQAKSVPGASTNPATSKTKEKKVKSDSVKDEPLPKYVEDTPPGEKKSVSRSADSLISKQLTQF